MKAIRRILAAIRRADQTFNLINDNDKIIVGVSGGKDSLMLIYALNLYTKFSKTNFEIIPVMLDLGFPNSDFNKISTWFEEHNMHLRIEDCQDVYKILDIQMHKQKTPHLPCSICSRMKKAAMNKVAHEIGANKVAFAHHADDAIETLIMNGIHGARFASFAPKMTLERAQVTFIRPLIFVRESDIISGTHELGIEPMKSPCPNDKITGREDTKLMLTNLYKKYSDAKDNFLTMMTNVDHEDLWLDKIQFKINSKGYYLKPVHNKEDGIMMMNLRYRIFVEELKVNYNDEFNDLGKESTQFLLMYNNEPRGFIEYQEIEPRHFVFKHLMVLKEYRRKHLCTEMMAYLEDMLTAKYNPCILETSIPAYLNEFIERLGYIKATESTYIKNIK